MTPGRLKIWNEDAGEWQYTPGGVEGSLRWSKVAAITYADILAAWDEMPAGATTPFDLATLPTNTMIDAYWFHSLVGFNDSGSIDYNLGWLLDSADPRTFASQQFTVIPQPGVEDDWAGASGTLSGNTAGGDVLPITGDSWYYGPLVIDAATAGPLQIKFISINGDGTGGAMDIWIRSQAPS